MITVLHFCGFRQKRGHGENVVMDSSFSSQEEYSCVKKNLKMWGTFLHFTERNKNERP